MVFLGDWSAKGQELHLCEHCRFHLMSLKLILKDRMNQLIICLYICSKTISTRFITTVGFVIIISQNPSMTKTLIMKGCAKERIEDIETLSKHLKEEEKKHICTENI